MKQPAFSRVSGIQERALIAKLKTARELISHPAEKGRSLEAEVGAVLRELLPLEYGVGTGFIAYHGDDGPRLSPQLDIIIFDAVRGGPLGSLAACEVYPIEAVYGYVEVKASISLAGPKAQIKHNSLQSCMRQNHDLRKLKKRMYWDTSYGSSPIHVKLITTEGWLPLRAFVFAFEVDGAAARDIGRLAQGMANAARDFDAHIHGVLVLDQAYLTTIPVDVKTADPNDYYHVSFTTEHPFAAFKVHLLKALGTFQRPSEEWTIAWESYFEMPRIWDEVYPEEST